MRSLISRLLNAAWVKFNHLIDDSDYFWYWNKSGRILLLALAPIIFLVIGAIMFNLSSILKWTLAIFLLIMIVTLLIYYIEYLIKTIFISCLLIGVFFLWSGLNTLLIQNSYQSEIVFIQSLFEFPNDRDLQANSVIMEFILFLIFTPIGLFGVLVVNKVNLLIPNPKTMNDIHEELEKSSQIMQTIIESLNEKTTPDISTKINEVITKINVKEYRVCLTCLGRGYESSHQNFDKPKYCSSCGGKGKIEF